MHRDGEKDLEDHERVSFSTPGNHIISVAKMQPEHCGHITVVES